MSSGGCPLPPAKICNSRPSGTRSAAEGARRQSPWGTGSGRGAAKEVIAADEWQANGMREDGWQRIPQSAPIAQGIEQPGSPRVASRRRLAARPRDQSPWPVRFVSMARHLLCRDCGRSSCSIMVYAQGRVEPDHCELSLLGCCPSSRAPVRRRPLGICISLALSISMSVGMSRVQCALIMASAMSRTLAWQFWGRRTSSDQAARGDGRSAGPPARSPLRSAAAGPQRP